jgi:hypothetical protein
MGVSRSERQVEGRVDEKAAVPGEGLWAERARSHARVRALRATSQPDRRRGLVAVPEQGKRRERYDALERTRKYAGRLEVGVERR